MTLSLCQGRVFNFHRWATDVTSHFWMQQIINFVNHLVRRSKTRAPPLRSEHNRETISFISIPDNFSVDE
jgi:hypothetical protein